MITLYTHNPHWMTIEYWKQHFRVLAGRYKGPDAVRDSVLRGLRQHKAPFELNPLRPRGKIVLVLSGVDALRYAITLKQKGVIERIVAGPNIVVTPHEHDEVMLHDAIDTILVPSSWVADFWTQEVPTLTEKIRVWPAGVPEVPPSNRAGSPILFNKVSDERLFQDTFTTIQSEYHAPPTVYTYSSFSHDDFLTALTNAPFMVYLSPSESQGLALQEAWAHNVPTFVQHSTEWNGGKYRFTAEKINAPYLTAELGGIFSNITELRNLIGQSASIHPKPYCDQHLSDNKSVEQLLQICHP